MLIHARKGCHGRYDDTAHTPYAHTPRRSPQRHHIGLPASRWPQAPPRVNTFPHGLDGLQTMIAFAPSRKPCSTRRHIKLIFRRNQRNINGLCPGQNRICPVISHKTGENTITLSPGITDGHHGTHHRLRSAAGHDDLLCPDRWCCPIAFPCFSASASRKFWAPKVMEY